MKLLLEREADVDATAEKGATALMLASASGHTEVVRLLLEWEADIDLQEKEDGFTALLLASATGHTEIVKLLLEQDADLDAKAKNGMTRFVVGLR